LRAQGGKWRSGREAKAGRSAKQQVVLPRDKK
jgi:hypothetical protein